MTAAAAAAAAESGGAAECAEWAGGLAVCRAGGLDGVSIESQRSATGRERVRVGRGCGSEAMHCDAMREEQRGASA